MMLHPMMLGMVSRWLLPWRCWSPSCLYFCVVNQPGGGFIAGLITAIAIPQQYIANGVEWVRDDYA